MKILAIDTSSARCNVSILENENVLIDLFNDDEKTHSVKLMPMINEAFKKTNLSLDDIDLLACSIGPGSFTGVRIGIATIKAFADVKKIPIVGISSLESLAFNVKNLSAEKSLVCSLIDAKNNNVYYGLFSFQNNTCSRITINSNNIDIVINEIKKIITNYKNIIFVGDAVSVYYEKLNENFTNIIFPSKEKNMQSGISLANAALIKYNEGKYGDSNSISPIYLRKSQAERAFKEKIDILPMTEEDILTITPDFNNNFDQFWNITNLENDFHAQNTKYFIAKLNNQIVGFAGILIVCDEANIMNIVTKVDKRHLGIASKLLETIIDISKKQGLKSITLEVNANNRYAIKLYENFNFQRIGFRKKYYNNTDDAILMTRDLKN